MFMQNTDPMKLSNEASEDAKREATIADTVRRKGTTTARGTASPSDPSTTLANGVSVIAWLDIILTVIPNAATELIHPRFGIGLKCRSTPMFCTALGCTALPK